MPEEFALLLPRIQNAVKDAGGRTIEIRAIRIAEHLAVQAGKAVACHMVLRFKDRWNSEYSGNTNAAITGANQLLYWHAIQRAQSSGAQRFSLGRTSPDHFGLLSYKKRWAPVGED